jgi:hypothetical protein
MSVELELWNIFTYYTLHGNPQDPEHLKCNQFVRLAKDADILGRRNSRLNNVAQADVELSFKAAIRSKSRRTTKKELLTYSDFLNCLNQLAPRVYPKSDKDTVFQQLLLENLLPLASRRNPEPMTQKLQDDGIQKIFEYYMPGLEQIFLYYAEMSEQRRRNAASVTKGSKQGKRRGADDIPVAEIMYPEYQRFCSEYKLTSAELISQLQAGDIFLCSTKQSQAGDDCAPLTLEEFPEVLFRASRMAHKNSNWASPEDKLNAIFLHMWKSVNNLDAQGKAVEQRSNMAAMAGDLNIGGSSLFNRLFMHQWRADGFRDYLNSDPELGEDAQSVLQRILERPAFLPPPTARVNEKDLQDLLMDKPEIAELLAGGSASEDGDSD